MRAERERDEGGGTRVGEEVCTLEMGLARVQNVLIHLINSVYKFKSTVYI